MVRDKVIDEMKLVFKEVPYCIEHMLRVLHNTDEIVAGEGISDDAAEIVSLSAILHDIGAIEAQKKHGSMNGHFQEIEGPSIAKGILERVGAPDDVIERVCYIVGNHHTQSKIDGIDFQILGNLIFSIIWNLAKEQRRASSLMPKFERISRQLLAGTWR